MTTVAAAPPARTDTPSRRFRPTGSLRDPRLPSLLLGAGVAVALVAVALAARGGDASDRESWTEIGLILAGTALVGAASWFHRGGRRIWGGATLVLFTAFAGLTAVSIAWSIFPEDSWRESGRTVAYLATFAGGVALARLLPRRPGALVTGVAIATAVIAMIGVAAKVAPASLAPDDLYGRLREPFDYWNAVGLSAAMGIPTWLWLGARRGGHGAWSAFAYPVTALLTTALLLSFSRGALVALALGLALWFALSEIRLRAALVLVAGAAGGLVLAAWAFSRPALTEDSVVLADRSGAGHQFGVGFVLVLGALLIFGVAANFVRDHEPLRERARRRIGFLLVALLVAAAGAGAGAVATSPGGFSRVWRQFTDPNAALPKNQPDRLTAAGSSRAQYWKWAQQVWASHRVLGAGAGGYATARKRYAFQAVDLRVGHAHGWVPQTLADFGLVGAGLSLLLLVAWGWAALRVVPLRPRGQPPLPRAAALTLLSVVVVFGVHSLADWSWFITGNAVVAMLCAGWLAGRGPLTELPWTGRPEPRKRWLPALVTGAFVILALLCCWSVLQPVRARHRVDDASLAAAEGKIEPARAAAREAARIDPLSPEPDYALATAAVTAGDEAGARAAYVRAVRIAPENADAWRRLGEFELDVANRPKASMKALTAALTLDPRSDLIERAFVRARRQAMNPASSATSAPDSGSSP